MAIGHSEQKEVLKAKFSKFSKATGMRGEGSKPKTSMGRVWIFVLEQHIVNL